MIIILH